MATPSQHDTQALSDSGYYDNITLKNGIEIITLTADIMGGHAEHWAALLDQPESDVPAWLGQMIESAVLPLGLCTTDTQLPQHSMLLATPDNIHPCQLIALDAEQKPTQLITAFPYADSPYLVHANIARIITNTTTHEAVLRLETADGTTLYAFDPLYSVNADQYAGDVTYPVALSGIAHEVTHITDDNTMTVTDPEAIRHHRALNAVLAKHNGVAPDNLQEEIAAWQPESDEDLLPITLNIANMCAYLFGEQVGQQDEAWCQGEVLGLQKITIMSQPLYLLDIAILREENTAPVVVRVVSHQNNTPETIQVGDFIRSNLWLQAKICATNMNNS